MSRKVKIIVAAGVFVAALAVVGYIFFAPQPTTTVDETLADESAERVRSGQFSGEDAAHDVSGTVAMYRGKDGHFLRFESYDATSGPDVFVYLSESAEGKHDEEAVRIPTPGGVGEGQATMRGNFSVPLPKDLDAKKFRSVIVWCKRFGVQFGHAVLK